MNRDHSSTLSFNLTMKNMNRFLVNSLFTAAVTCFASLYARSSPVGGNADSKLEHVLNSNKYDNAENFTHVLNCETEEYDLEDVVFQNNSLFLKAKNITVYPSEYQTNGGKIFLCLPYELDNASVPTLAVGAQFSGVLNCSEKFMYDSNEFYMLPNKSAVVSGEVVPEGEYELKGGNLLTCATDYDDIDSGGITLQEISIYVGQIGSVISIVALILHLLTFSLLPTLRNIPGCNLASLSIAMLLAYFFVLIGQIPQVLGVFCAVSGILQQYFFLVAFFCMNVLAFDVWKTLKLATQKLIVGSQNTRNRQFIWYSLYAWGIPLMITSISVVVDNVDGVPDEIKPNYGKDNICWMDNKMAKAIFFAVPAFTLFLINGVFFILSAWMIYSNTMKFSSDHSSQSVKTNYILYVRLALMMGLTWLLGLIAIFTKSEVIWFLFDLLNSLQGLFLFLLFTCSKKVFKSLKGKRNTKSSSVKQSTLTSNSGSFDMRI